MVRNLVRNAIDYTPRGGRVFVASRRRGPELRIEVRDTGAGIRSSVLAAIFDAFQRADNTRADGLGLGLFIVKRAADLLGHRVEVHSIEGRGSRFAVVTHAARYRSRRPGATDMISRNKSAKSEPRFNRVLGEAHGHYDRLRSSADEIVSPSD